MGEASTTRWMREEGKVLFKAKYAYRRRRADPMKRMHGLRLVRHYSFFWVGGLACARATRQRVGLTS